MIEQRKARTLEGIAAEVIDHFPDPVAGTEDQRRFLLERIEAERENELAAVAGESAGLLGQHGQRQGVEQQAQATVVVSGAGVGRVEKNAAATQDPVGLGHQ